MRAESRAGFRRLLVAEWTKLRTVLGTVGCLAAIGGALLALALLISSGGNRGPDGRDRAADVDEFRFVHRPLVGDGSLVARVRTQEANHPWAMAGVMVKQAPTPGAPYAALMVTKGHGVRLQANFTADVAGGPRSAPRYLRLTRTGDTVVGHESADGTSWDRVGAVTLPGLATTVHVGLFATAPDMSRVQPMRPALVQVRPDTVTFDGVRLTPATGQPEAAWAATDVGRPGAASEPARQAADGVFTVIGDGDILRRSDDGSRIVAATAGTIFGVLPAVALGALVVTSEYRWRIVRTTLTASPGRGAMLAAKAVVAAATTFGVGAAAALTALLATQPLLRRGGFRPPVYPDPSPLDPGTLRVVAGTGAFLALLALVGLGAGAALRRSAGAITLVAAAVFVPIAVTPFLPASVTLVLQRVTPLAGASIQQVRETDDSLLLPWAGRPWTGLLILSGYAAAALGAGLWRLRRSDA